MTTPYILRSVQLSDLGDLHQLSKLVNFINLPPDEEQLEQLIKRSQKSFPSPLKRLDENYYMFVVENRSNGKFTFVRLVA